MNNKSPNLHKKAKPQRILVAFDIRRTKVLTLGILWYVVILWYSWFVCIFAAIFYMCLRITLVRSWPHPDNATDVDKHRVLRVWQVPAFLGVTTLLGQEILYRSNRAQTLKKFPARLSLLIYSQYYLSLARKTFRDKVLLPNFTRVLLRLYM